MIKRNLFVLLCTFCFPPVLFGQETTDRAGKHYNLGVKHKKEGSLNLALMEFHEALELYRFEKGKNHQHTIACCEILADLYDIIGRQCQIEKKYDDALHNYRQGLAARESVLGVNNTNTAGSHKLIGSVLKKKQMYDEALIHYRKTLEIRQLVFGNSSKETARAHPYIGSVLEKQRNYDKALIEYQSVLSILEETGTIVEAIASRTHMSISRIKKMQFLLWFDWTLLQVFCLGVISFFIFDSFPSDRSTKVFNQTSSNQTAMQKGVSVHFIATNLWKEIQDAGFDDTAMIKEIENLQGPPGVIRRKGLAVISPADGRMGAAYADCLTGEDNVGPAGYMLSYSWGNRIGDIVDVLMNFCETKNLDPKRQYVWIDCLVRNQHRVVEAQQTGKSGLGNFEDELKDLLTQCGHMLALMAPWKKASYLTRIWCIYEMYMANQLDCIVDILMPQRERDSLEEDLFFNQKGVDNLYKALADTRIENAQATYDAERHRILGLIDKKFGCSNLNNSVNDCLRIWVRKAIKDIIDFKLSDTNYRNKQYKTKLTYGVAEFLSRNGEFDEAAKLYNSCISLQGERNLIAANAFNGLGLIFQQHGDYRSALRSHIKARDIQKLLGVDDKLVIGQSTKNIGNSLCGIGEFRASLYEYRRALKMHMSLLGRCHPGVASLFNNIGFALQKQGDLTGALEGYRLGRDIYEESGQMKTHPETALCYVKIGHVLEAKGDFKAALAEYDKGLKIQLSLLGNHADTAKTYVAIGNLLLSRVDFETAMFNFRKAHAIFVSNLGPYHPTSRSAAAKITETFRLKCLVGLFVSEVVLGFVCFWIFLYARL